MMYQNVMWNYDGVSNKQGLLPESSYIVNEGLAQMTEASHDVVTED